VLGHRGASAHAVENTLAAFERARADGADGVELDVRLTGDGGMVVFHDDDLVRLAGGRPDRIDRLDRAAIAGVRLDGGERIPTLDEVFEALPGLLINVEIKSSGPRTAAALARAVARAIARAGAADRVVISSFDPGAVFAARALAPHVRRGLLFHAGQPKLVRAALVRRATRPFAMHPERILLNRDAMVLWRKAGYAVHTWTVDGAAEVRRVAGLGVDAIISNDPAATRAALGALAQNPS
jgi:glycerophosphoryl diester phosphodiesterase